MGRTKRIFKKRMPPVGRWKHGSVVPEVPEKIDTQDDDLKKENVSFRKLSQSKLYYSQFANQDDKYDIVNLEYLTNIINDMAVCKECGEKIEIVVTKRVGLAIEMCVSCAGKCNSVTAKNSTFRQDANVYAINTRFIYAMRCIGKGQANAKTFCGLMNLPPPPSKYKNYIDVLHTAATTICNNSMLQAANEAFDHNEGSHDIAVAVDGTWQKRGYSSNNGVVTATSYDTGKVIDIQVYSKFCRCPKRLDKIHETNCIANFCGTSGAMEVAGVKAIFERSQAKYNARYLQCLGDGDSAAYPALVAAAPYGKDVSITKLECIGHVKKRMGTRLKAFKAKYGTDKLSDGKGLNGQGRLTGDVILEIQKYYGLAIQRNTTDVLQMKQAIWAEYFHILSDNENPQHGLCPDGIDSWCKFKTAEATGLGYDHTNHFHISPVIMEAIKPIFRDLAAAKLLERCLHGKTQNQNESVNNVIWSRIPKMTFVNFKSLELGVLEAVSSFNDGCVSNLLLLKEAGVEPGLNCIKMMKSNDDLRCAVAQRKQTALEKKARQKRHKRQLQLEQSFLDDEGTDEPAYKTGCY